jgi:hypothetical protein
MKKSVVALISTGLLCGGAGHASAQSRSVSSSAQQSQSRYQIGQMERVLEGAVEHGVKVWRDQFQSTIPFDMQPIANAKVRGIRLDGYGIVFDVEVPALESAPLWSFQTLDQNDLGLSSALNALRAFVESTGDQNVQQALRRVELQVTPVSASQTAAAPDASPSRDAAPHPPTISREPRTVADVATSLSDAQEAYRTEVKNALSDAMLDYSRGLEIAAGEWLAIAARNNDERPSLAPADSDSRTVIIRLRGSDLTAFLGGQITRDEAKARMDVRVF